MLGRENIRELMRQELQAAADTGNVTSATASTLEDTGKRWGVDVWANFVCEITFGKGVGQIRKITSNTSTALTVAPDWDPVPDITSKYAIRWVGSLSFPLTLAKNLSIGIAEDLVNIAKTLDVLDLRDKLMGTDARSMTELYNNLMDILGRLDITTSSFRNALQGVDARSLTDVYDNLGTILSRLDITVGDLRDALTGIDARTLTDLFDKVPSLLQDLTGAVVIRPKKKHDVFEWDVPDLLPPGELDPIVEIEPPSGRASTIKSFNFAVDSTTYFPLPTSGSHWFIITIGPLLTIFGESSYDHSLKYIYSHWMEANIKYLPPDHAAGQMALANSLAIYGYPIKLWYANGTNGYQNQHRHYRIILETIESGV